MSQQMPELFEAKGKHTGLMIAAWLDPVLAQAIVLPGGEAPDQLHITLCYCGDANELSDVQIGRAIAAAADTAQSYGPLSGSINGLLRFNGSESSDGLDVFAAQVDVPGLDDLRHYLASSLEHSAGCPPLRNHGFTPHVTLAYLSPDADLPMQRLPTQPLTIRSIWVSVGERRTEIPLTGSQSAVREMADKQLAPAPAELSDRIQRLVAAYHPHLVNARIEVQVRDTAKVDDSSVTIGEVDTADNDGEKRQFDFTIWFALDTWQTMSEWQRDALCDHELSHCAWDEKGEPLLVAHDIEEFNAVIARWGLWWHNADATLAALQMMPAPVGPEGVTEMAQAYQRPMPSGGGWGGMQFQRPMPSGGGWGGMQFQRPMPSGGGWGGMQAGAPVSAWADPHLQPGSDYHTVPVGEGQTIDLCPACYAQLVASILADLEAAVAGG